MPLIFGIWWTQHWVIQGSYHKDVCAMFDLLLEVFLFLFTIDKDVCIKDSL